MTASGTSTRQEKLFSTVYETRTMMAFRLHEDALLKLLPEGWRVDPVAAGHARGANFRFGLSDQLAAINADGSSAEAHRFCPMTVTAIRDGMAAPQRMAIGVWSTGSDPGRMRHPDRTQAVPLAPARMPDTAEVERSIRADVAGVVTLKEAWRFSAPADRAPPSDPTRAVNSLSGETLTLDLAWTRGPLERSMEEFRIYAPSAGDTYRQYRIEQVEEVVFSVSLGVDRTSRRSYRATGPLLSRLFDGTEELVSIAVQPCGRREVYLA